MESWNASVSGELLSVSEANNGEVAGSVELDTEDASILVVSSFFRELLSVSEAHNGELAGFVEFDREDVSTSSDSSSFFFIREMSASSEAQSGELPGSEHGTASSASSFFREMPASSEGEAHNGDALGSELDTEDDAPASSVLPDGVSDSGLQLGVTAGPRTETISISTSPEALGSGCGGGAAGSGRVSSVEHARLSRSTLGRERLTATMLHWSSSMQRVSSTLRSLSSTTQLARARFASAATAPGPEPATILTLRSTLVGS